MTSFDPIVIQTAAKKPESYTLAFLLFAVLVLVLGGCTRSPDSFSVSGSVMGTSYSVQAIAIPDGIEPQKLEVSIAEVLNAVDARMSTYKPKSELSRLNHAAVKTTQPISRQLAAVLKMALDVYQNSGGAFDVTVGPLVQLWGFGSRNQPLDAQVRPKQPKLEEVLSAIGSEHLHFNSGELSLRKNSALEIDLSAIAKGYAVDELANYLQSKGIENFLVEVGGELRASGLNKRGQLWLVGVETPDAAPGKALGAVPLRDIAIATSGDYRNYFEENGVRYSHTIDPRTGQPVSHRLASVSVLHESAALADAWATALNVLGPVDGLALADELGLKAFFVIRSDNSDNSDGSSADIAFSTQASDGYKAYNDSVKR